MAGEPRRGEAARQLDEYLAHFWASIGGGCDGVRLPAAGEGVPVAVHGGLWNPTLLMGPTDDAPRLAALRSELQRLKAVATLGCLENKSPPRSRLPRSTLPPGSVYRAETAETRRLADTLIRLVDELTPTAGGETPATIQTRGTGDRIRSVH